MLLAIVVLLSAIVLFFIMPLLTLKRYYRPSEHSFAYNIFWLLVTIITWPIVPYVIAARRKDSSLLKMLWISLLIFVVSFGYWFYLSLDQLMIAGEQIA